MSEFERIVNARKSASVIKSILPLHLFFNYARRGAMAYVINAYVDENPGKKFKLCIQIQFGGGSSGQVFNTPTKAGICMWASIVDKFDIAKPDYWERKGKITFDGWGWLKVSLPDGHIITLNELMSKQVRTGDRVASLVLDANNGRKDIRSLVCDPHYVVRTPLDDASPVYQIYCNSVSKRNDVAMKAASQKRQLVDEDLFPAKKYCSMTPEFAAFSAKIDDYAAMLRVSTGIQDMGLMASHIGAMAFVDFAPLIPRRNDALPIHQAAQLAASVM